MSKLGYFFAGVVAGATALTAAAFMVDDVVHKLDAVSDDEISPYRACEHTNSYKLAEEEAVNFYIRFDKAFIDLYPNFVEEFNQLLLPEKQIVLPAPNSLTKELRIYALMRLGITDGQELATLLFYSTQTIYNYKTAIRKRAKDLTTFDAAINRLCNVIG